MVDLEKICNIAGYPIYSWASAQLKKRSELGSLNTKRSDDNLSYLANKNAWVRVISSIDLNKTEDQQGGQLTKHIKSIMPNPFTNINKDNLSKNFILYGGVSTWANNSMGLRSGVGADGAYGTLGSGEITEFGYKPMPGITSLEIESLGRLGSLRQATIKLKVHDKQQLDLIDALYFRLGYSIIIEWGHAKYYDNNGVLQSSEQYMIDPYKESKTSEDILISINKNTQKSCGNYGGMFGIITNFEYSYSQDGGYDCTIKVYSPGVTFGNMPINRPSVLSKVYENQLTLFLNDEKFKRIEEKKIELQQQEQKKIEDLNNTLNPSIWASFLRNNAELPNDSEDKVEPGVPNAPLATLLYNTKNLPSADNVIKGGKKYGRTVATLVNEYKGGHSLLYSNYYDKSELSPYTETALDKKLGGYYKVEDNGEGDIIYFSDKRKYITPNKKITVKLDFDRIKQLSIRQGFTSVEEVLNRPGIGDSRGFTYGEVSYKGLENDSYKFTISYEVNSPAITRNIDIRSFLENKDTEYEIAGISWKPTEILGKVLLVPSIKLTVVNNPKVIVYLGEGTNTVEDLDVTKIYLADLRLIKEIKYPASFNDLTTNKEFVNFLTARENINKETISSLNTLTNQIEVDITQIKKTLDSESALELMLRSIQLYGLTGDESAKTEFIKQLFSEGAYSKFFQNGYPDDKNLPTGDALAKKYLEAGLTKEERLLVNLLYGNNYQLLSGENALNPSTGIKSGLFGEVVPKVDFEQLLKLITLEYGEDPILETNGTSLKSEEFKKSIYINLGLFFLMLNHTAVLYTKDEEKSDVMTPITYIDFNPNTNFYLSSINQISVDRKKFIVGYYGDVDDYKELFDKSLLEGNTLRSESYEMVHDTNNWVSKKVPTVQATLFNPEKEDAITYLLPKTQKKDLKGNDSPYVGRLMDVSVNVNYLLSIIKQYAVNSNTHEVYFQTLVERILDDLNTSMGYYNAFRLSYNDNSNCYVITDDQIQPADPTLISEHSDMITSDAYEIPVYGKSSIARNLELRTDLSGRIASMIAISANPTLDTQVGLGKDSSDFGIYNLGTEDRYKKYTVDSKTPGANKQVGDNAKMAEIAANFNEVVRKTYYSGIAGKLSLSDDQISKATNYYIERMSYVKNMQSGSIHSLIIPIKSSITMDGMSALYPFQLYTVSENVMPYRYSVSNLNKKVAYSISKVVHTFDNNQWVTKIEGFMTLLKDKSYYQTKSKVRTARKPEIIMEAQATNRTDLDTSPVKISKYPILTTEFLSKLDSVCAKLGCKRDDMLRVMYAESTLNPKAENKDSGASGLLQFTSITYPTIGVRNKQEILQSSPIKQLDYVEKYFLPYKGKLGSLYLLYGATFLPNLILSRIAEDSYVLASAGTKVAEQNPSMRDSQGKITIGSFKQYVNNISYKINS